MKGWILKLAVALLIFAAIFSRVGIDQVWDVALGANPVFFGLAFLTLVLSLFLDTINLKILLRPLAHIGTMKLFRYYLFGWTLGIVTPGKVGEFSISFFLKEKVKVGESTAVYTIVKATTVLALILFSITGFFMFLDFWTALGLVALFMVLWMLCILALLSDWGRGIVKKYVLRGKAAVFEGFSDTFTGYLKRRKRLVILALCFALVRWTVNCVVVYLVFLTFGQAVNFSLLLALYPLATLATILPITFSGLGVREGIFIFATSRAGIAASLSTTVSLFMLVIDYTFVLIILPILLKSINLSTLFRELKSVSSEASGS